MPAAEWLAASERLDRALPALKLARSRSRAVELIGDGRVRVDGVIATKASLRVSAGSSIEVSGADHYVSRAARKLIAGLDVFGVNPEHCVALDVGASTGGFTQVLLERGATRVLAIDVGHGQLDKSLIDDARVHLVEGCNARDLTAESLRERTGVPDAPDIVVADLSFISLELVLPALARVAAPNAQFVLLIKPQFEVGRGGIENGIVTDPALAAQAVSRVILAAAQLGLQCRGLAASPITGEYGNREVLAHFERASGVVADQTEWSEHIRELFEPGGDR